MEGQGLPLLPFKNTAALTISWRKNNPQIIQIGRRDGRSEGNQRTLA
jgi:hypothetical protein